jgi:hypothetical protein
VADIRMLGVPMVDAMLATVDRTGVREVVLVIDGQVAEGVCAEQHGRSLSW